MVSYHNNSVTPIATDLLAATQKLMKVIRCNCKAGCTITRCGCRQIGMPCSAICSKCMGICYSNTPQAEDDLCPLVKMSCNVQCNVVTVDH